MPDRSEGDSVTGEPEGLFGFPLPLHAALGGVEGIGPSSPCGLCGDTILGQRHRIIDAIGERLLIGDEDPGEDWGIAQSDLGVIVAAFYEHDKALKRQRRAAAKAAKVPADLGGIQ